MSENRVPVTVRLSPEDKEFFRRATEDAGVEPGTAARQIIELVIRRMRAGADYIDTLQIVKNALKPVVRVPARTA